MEMRTLITLLTLSMILGCGSAIENGQTVSEINGISNDQMDNAAPPLYQGMAHWFADQTLPEGGVLLFEENPSPANLINNVLQPANYLAAGPVETVVTNSVNISTKANDSGMGTNNLYFSYRDNSVNAYVCIESKNATTYADTFLGVKSSFLTAGNWLTFGTNANKVGTSGYVYWGAGDTNGIGSKTCTPFGIYNTSGTASVSFPVEVRGKATTALVVVDMITSGLAFDHPIGAKSDGYQGNAEIPWTDDAFITNPFRIVIKGQGLTNVSSVDITVDKGSGVMGTETLAMLTQTATLISTKQPTLPITGNPSGKVATVKLTLSDATTRTFTLKLMARFIFGMNTLAGDVGHITAVFVDWPTGLSNSGTASCPTGTFATTDFLTAMGEVPLSSAHTVYSFLDDINCPTIAAEYFRLLGGSDTNNSSDLDTGDSVVTGSFSTSSGGCGLFEAGPANMLSTANRTSYSCGSKIIIPILAPL